MTWRAENGYKDSIFLMTPAARQSALAACRTFINGDQGAGGRAETEFSCNGRKCLANRVSVITSTAEREAAIDFAKANAMRPRIVGGALSLISADPEVTKAVFDVLEIESLLEGKVKVTLLPEQGDLLAQMTAIAGRPG